MVSLLWHFGWFRVRWGFARQRSGTRKEAVSQGTKAAKGRHLSMVANLRRRLVRRWFFRICGDCSRVPRSRHSLVSRSNGDGSDKGLTPLMGASRMSFRRPIGRRGWCASFKSMLRGLHGRLRRRAAIINWLPWWRTLMVRGIRWHKTGTRRRIRRVVMSRRWRMVIGSPVRRRRRWSLIVMMIGCTWSIRRRVGTVMRRRICHSAMRRRVHRVLAHRGSRWNRPWMSSIARKHSVVASRRRT